MANFPNILDTPAAGGGGAYTLLDTQLVSNGASLDFANISQAYNSLRIIGKGFVPITNSQVPYILVSTDGGSSFLTTAIYDRIYTGFFGSQQDNLAVNQNQIDMLRAGALILGSAGAGLNFVMDVLNYTDEDGSGLIKFLWRANVAQTSVALSWDYDGSAFADVGAAINGLRFVMSSGNLNGQARLYGLT